MFLGNLRWNMFRKDPRSVSMVVKRIPERARRRYYSVLAGTGSPTVLWQSNYTVPWQNQSPQKCYCYNPEHGDAQGALRHSFCYGSGYIDYYQRWGFEDRTYWPAVSDDSLIVDDNIVRLYEEEATFGKRPVWVAKDSGRIIIHHTPQRDPLRWTWIKGEGVFSGDKYVKVVYAGIEHFVPMECEYSDNGICKFKVLLDSFWDSTMSFEIPLEKDERLYYARIRTQHEYNLNEIDPRFPDVDFPAILVARDQPKITLKPDDQRAIKMVFPMKFWTIDVEIHANDVLWLLTPPFNAYRYVVSADADGIDYSVIGHPPVITKVSFTGVMIRSPDDRLGVLFELE